MKEQGEDLNLAMLLRDLWAVKLFLVVGLLAGLIGAFVIVKVSVPHYQASMMIGPAQHINVSAHGGALEQRVEGSAVQRRAHVNPAPHFTSFEAIYAGASTARLLLRDERVLAGLANDQSFVFDDLQESWSAPLLAEYIRKRVWLDSFGESELRSLNYRHRDPAFAAYFVQQIHRTADQLIRGDLRDGVDQRIAYLERSIAKTLNPEHRRAITGLLLEQERVRMVVSLPEPVAAKVIEAASAKPKPVWPDKALLFFGLGFLGLFLGYIVSGCVRSSSEYA